ncbi:MAG: hypothetical protein L6Q51_14545 [Cyclobacteriaceae bacterium]|nr:hypothetical protein [Cyclobacteriaceae bacterium]
MTHKIQRTIIGKFLQLADKQLTHEDEVTELLETIQTLYQRKILTNNDIYRQKLEIVSEILSNNKETLSRKRNSKEIKIEMPGIVYEIFKSDVQNFDISTKLSDLDKLENENHIKINRESVSQILENIIIPKNKLNKESDLELFLAWELAYIFGKEKISNQYSVGGFLALKTDLDIGNGQVGIELKIADNLGATDMQRLIGQVLYYKKRFYNDNLLVFIGSKYSIPSHMKELSDFIEELGIKVIYRQGV